MKFTWYCRLTRGAVRRRGVQATGQSHSAARGVTGADRCAERRVGDDRRGRHRQLLIHD